MNATKPVLDFENDLKDHFARGLILAGFPANSSENLNSLGVRFFNILSRNISVRPRVVHESKELSCSSSDQIGYAALKKKIENGENINSNLSIRRLDANYQDLLLWDWGIHHFHLGQVVSMDGFVTRTDSLLFARVDDTNFYAIQILNHSSFTNYELVQIVHENWPQLIEKCRLKGIIGLERNYSDQELGELRRAGVQTMIEVERGIVYAPIGGGYSTAGTSIRTQMQADYWIRRARDIGPWIIEHHEEMRSKLRDKGMIVPDPLRFKLLIDQKGLYAIEMQSRVAFLMFSYKEGN